MSGSLREYHHLVSKMPDVLNGVVGSGVVVKDRNREFLQEFSIPESLRRDRNQSPWLWPILVYYGVAA